MRSALRTVALAVSAWFALVSPARADVQLSLRNGRVTLIARDVTVRQILAEWARVGRTTIVNAERIPGGPVTIELRDVPEAEALDVLLRALSGYIAAPRAAMTSSDVSVYDSIAVMPTIASTVRPPATSAAPSPFSPPPVFNQNEDDDNAGARPAGVNQPPRPPIFSTFPTPQQGNGAAGSARPVLPVVRPGVIAQPQNNQNEFQQPVVQPQIIPAPVPSSGPPASTPGGAPVGVSAPGMIAPAPSTAPPQPIRTFPND
jgi:hypothetical protein